MVNKLLCGKPKIKSMKVFGYHYGFCIVIGDARVKLFKRF